MSKYTKQALKTAFIKLLNEQPFEKIKVKDIVEECQCNRNTFYYYYQDIYALLEELLEEEIEKAIARTGNFEKWQDGLIIGIQFLMENKRAAYHIYNSIGRKEIEHYIERVAGWIIEEFVTCQSADLKLEPSDKRLIISFYMHAITGMFEEWMDKRMQLDAETVIRRIGQIMDGSVRRMCERAANKK